LSAARNAGLRYVPNETEIVLFLDDDVTIDTHYVEELKETFKAHPEISGASGQLKDGYHNSSMIKKIFYAIVGFILPPLVPVSINKYHITRTAGIGTMPLFVDKDPVSVEWLSGCNMAYRNSIFKNDAKFDETLIEYGIGEDALFSHKLWLKGKRFAISRKSLIEHRISNENRMPPFKKLLMIFTYRRYLIQNFTENKILASLYYYWFAITFIASIFILCLIGKSKWEYLKNAFLSHWYIIEEPSIEKINKFIKGVE
jgi:GT2 family glycosyltransferase